MAPPGGRRRLAVFCLAAAVFFASPAATAAAQDAPKKCTPELINKAQNAPKLGAYLPVDCTLEDLLAAAKNLPAEWKEKPYKVTAKGVDLATFRGWRQFHGFCQTCHGTDALGTLGVGPNLIEEFNREQDPVTYESYVTTFMNGRTNPQDPAKVMLPFAGNKDFVKNIDNIYAYLKWRAADPSKPGRPPRHRQDLRQQ